MRWITRGRRTVLGGAQGEKKKRGAKGAAAAAADELTSVKWNITVRLCDGAVTILDLEQRDMDRLDLPRPRVLQPAAGGKICNLDKH